jgi:hypothetical protein
MLHATGGHPRTICSRLASKQHRSTYCTAGRKLPANFARAPTVQNNKCSQAHLENNYLNLKTIPQTFVLYCRGLQFSVFKTEIEIYKKRNFLYFLKNFQKCLIF